MIYAYSFLDDQGFRCTGGSRDPNFFASLKERYQGRIFDIVEEKVSQEEYDAWVARHDKQLTLHSFTRTSPLTGVPSTRRLYVDPDKLAAWERGELYLQHAFPHLSPNDREFIKGGLTPEDCDEVFGTQDV